MRLAAPVRIRPNPEKSRRIDTLPLRRDPDRLGINPIAIVLVSMERLFVSVVKHIGNNPMHIRMGSGCHRNVCRKSAGGVHGR